MYNIHKFINLSRGVCLSPQIRVQPSLIRQVPKYSYNFARSSNPYLHYGRKFATSKTTTQNAAKETVAKDKGKEIVKETGTVTTTATNTAVTTTTTNADKVEKIKVWLKGVPALVRETIHHYWTGTKLFVAETKTAWAILRSITKGKKLTRRERVQLMRTSADMFRLIPFMVFVIVPFMEFLLPVALKIFPNMLPSTFEDKLKKEEGLKKRLKARIEIAKFLQDTAELVANDNKIKAEMQGLDISDLMRKIRVGEPVSNSEILLFAKSFEDEFTLDNLSRPQLVAMCKYIGYPPYGNDKFLKFLVSQKLQQIKTDDKLIQEEGVNSLTLEELQAALRARGMKYSGSKVTLRKRLNEWLELSLTHNLPTSLLILSRAFIITENEKYQDALKETLASLPEEVVEEIKVKVEQASADVKLELLNRQKGLMEKEQKESDQELKLKKEQEEKRLEEKKTAAAAAATTAAAPNVPQTTVGTTSTQTTEVKTKQGKATETAKETKTKEKETGKASSSSGSTTVTTSANVGNIPTTPSGTTSTTGTTTATPTAQSTTSSTKKEGTVDGNLEEKIKDIGQAVSVLAGSNPIEKEKLELLGLKQERQERKKAEDLKEKETSKEEKKIDKKEKVELDGKTKTTGTTTGSGTTQGTATTSAVPGQLPKELEEKAKKEKDNLVNKRLEERLDKMILELEQEVANVEQKLGNKMHIIDTDNDGIITTNELQSALGLLKEKLSDEEIQTVIKNIDRDADGVISVKELLQYASERFPQKFDALLSNSAVQQQSPKKL